MDAKHTPRPWHYQEGSDAYTHIVRAGALSRDNPHSGRKFLCQLSQDHSGEAEANARLIAAAPDLLEALKKIVKDWDGELEDILDAHAAIAKAEGRQP